MTLRSTAATPGGADPAGGLPLRRIPEPTIISLPLSSSFHHDNAATRQALQARLLDCSEPELSEDGVQVYNT
jgi:hypothetical protein